MTSRTIELERQLTVEKDRLRASLSSLGARASEAVDWRQQLREHPVEILGAAVVVGALLGALTGANRSRRGSGATDEEPRAHRQYRDTHERSRRAPSPEWLRLKHGLTGLAADRAILFAQNFLGQFGATAGPAKRRESAPANGDEPDPTR
ncbi:MAG: hypothetical protein Q8K82_24830 [Gemmatimonadaceae bacterium]|nr:hypothetical protein [Gemmatimonadaceae bacterium]